MGNLLKVARGIDWLNEKVGHGVYWLGLAMVLIGVYNATVRYLGDFIGANLSSNFYLEAQWYLFGAMFMLGASYTLRHDTHVRVDVVYAKLSARGKAWVDLVGTLVFLIPFCLVVVWLSLDWVAASWEIRETSSNPGGLARYPIKTIIPLAFVFLTLQGIAEVIKATGVLTGYLPPARGPDKSNGPGEG